MKEIEINKEAIEPKDYFKILKDNIKKSVKDKLESQLEALGGQLIHARDIGQKNFLERLSFCYEVIVKEQKLLAQGIDRFVYKDDIKSFLDIVTPKNSIKIIELSRYPRAIPIDNLKAVQVAKELEIFDDFCVIFTDLTGQDYQTPEEKKFVAKNRDPIVFGYFKDKSSATQHERFYFVTDWEDEYCDLTFTKMIERMAEKGIKKPEHKIDIDHKYLAELVAEVREPKKPEEKKKSFWEKIWPLQLKSTSQLKATLHRNMMRD